MNKKKEICFVCEWFDFSTRACTAVLPYKPEPWFTSECPFECPLGKWEKEKEKEEESPKRNTYIGKHGDSYTLIPPEEW